MEIEKILTERSGGVGLYFGPTLCGSVQLKRVDSFEWPNPCGNVQRFH